MKRKVTYKMPHRRRREGRTDYRQRLRLLKSKKPRLVVRKSLNNMTCQVIVYNPKGDKTTVTVNATSLKKLGWKAHSGSIPAAYLIGFACGTEAKKRGINQAIADLGLQTSTKWSRLYAAMKGAMDAGLDIPHSSDIIPPEERITGKHISSYASQLKKEDPEKYKKLFSGYIKNKLQPEDLEKHVLEVKKKIA